jgi:hypothetical protein
VPDDAVGDPARGGGHPLVERGQQDGHVEAAEHRRLDGGVDGVELAGVAHPLPVLCREPSADHLDDLGHPGERPVRRHAEPVAVDLRRPGTEAEKQPARGVPGERADGRGVRVGRSGEGVGDRRSDQRTLGVRDHLGEHRVGLVVDEVAGAERGDAGVLASRATSAPGHGMPKRIRCSDFVGAGAR